MNKQEESLRRWSLIFGDSEKEDQGKGDEKGQEKGQEKGSGGQGEKGQGKERGGAERNRSGGSSKKTDREISEMLNYLKGRRNGKSSSGGSGSDSGSGKSQYTVGDWLRDVRETFPDSISERMQREMVKASNIEEILEDEDAVDSLPQDASLIAAIVEMASIMDEDKRNIARRVVQRMVDQIMQQVQVKTEAALRGALNRSRRKINPKISDINWHQTIRRNLKNYQPDLNTVIPETIIGYQRKNKNLRHIFICVDQSGSMSESIVNTNIFAAVLASIPGISVHMVLFDTSAVDVSDMLNDPVSLLFSMQLGGGTNIDGAIKFTERLMADKSNSIFFLISDLLENGSEKAVYDTITRLHGEGVQFASILGLTQSGNASYHHKLSAALVQGGVPSFVCTPDLFPDLIAACINKHDLASWQANEKVVSG